MLKGAVIFTAGIATGVVGLPVALIYIPAIRRPFAKGCAKMFMDAMDKSPEFRASVIETAEEAQDILERFATATTNDGFDKIVNENLKDEGK